MVMLGSARNDCNVLCSCKRVHVEIASSQRSGCSQLRPADRNPGRKESISVSDSECARDSPRGRRQARGQTVGDVGGHGSRAGGQLHGEEAAGTTRDGAPLSQEG